MNERKKIRVTTLQAMKQAGEKIVCLTAYDASFARLSDDAGVDVLLAGDSLGMVLQGADNTLRVSMADMVYHSRLVDAGRRHALLVADLPFMSYASPAQALGNAARLVAQGGAEVVKLEGGRELCETVARLDGRGIPVCAHLGLTPQFTHRIGGYRAQGRDEKTAARIKEDALLLQGAGAVMLVLECVPSTLAAALAGGLDIPVIGIGAGRACDGQVLVSYDALGLSAGYRGFSKVFLGAAAPTVPEALRAYVDAVREGRFPMPEHEVR